MHVYDKHKINEVLKELERKFPEHNVEFIHTSYHKIRSQDVGILTLYFSFPQVEDKHFNASVTLNSESHFKMNEGKYKVLYHVLLNQMVEFNEKNPRTN